MLHLYKLSILGRADHDSWLCKEQGYVPLASRVLRWLFRVLSDGNRKILQAADSTLAEALKRWWISLRRKIGYGWYPGPLIVIKIEVQSHDRTHLGSWIYWLGWNQPVRLHVHLLYAIAHSILIAKHDIEQIAEWANEDCSEFLISRKQYMCTLHSCKISTVNI